MTASKHAAYQPRLAGNTVKPPPTQEDIDDWNRWFGVEMNNRAWEIVENPARNSSEAEEMLHAANAAAIHWSKVGTELNNARANMLLGLVYAIHGHGALAMVYAQRSFQYLTSVDSPDWEIAFAHAALAFAAFSAQNHELHARHYALSKSCGESIEDNQEKEIFLRTFRQLPPPAAN